MHTCVMMTIDLGTGQKKRLLGGIKRTKAMWERWYEAIMEEEKLQGSKDITVQCVDFCEAMTSRVHAVLQHAPFDLRRGTFRQHPRVLVATVDYQENPHLCMQILMLPCSRFLEVHTYDTECWPSRRIRRLGGF